jgi:enoyl-CoA hydratase/carnithine racemase
MIEPNFMEYKDKYPHVRMERKDGILLLQLHSKGKSLMWGPVKTEIAYMLADVGQDAENRVIILTGTGESFIDGVEKTPNTSPLKPSRFAYNWSHKGMPEGKKLIMNHLDVQAPMIAAVNGPATVHAEMALLCDVVLAAPQATFQDAPHFSIGVLPGDGVHVIWPLLLGMNRARYFLLTGQTITAHQALSLGLVNEVVPAEKLMDRAWQVAQDIAAKPSVVVRLFREAVLQPMKRAVRDDLGYGYAMQGLAAFEHWPFGGLASE